jgi:hypothetical protein
VSEPETGVPTEEDTSVKEREDRIAFDLSELQDLHCLPGAADTDLGRDNIDYVKSTLGSQMKEMTSKLSESFSPTLVRKGTKAISQVVLLAIGLQSDTNLQSVLTRCTAFLDALLDDGLVMNLHDLLKGYVDKADLPEAYQGKSLREIFDLENQASKPETLPPTALAVWETLKKGVFTKHLSYVIGTAFALSTCKIRNIEFSHPLHDKIMEHATADEINGIDLIDHVLKLYNWVSTVGQACLEQRSLKPLTLNSGGLAKCHETYYKIDQWFKDVKRGKAATTEERQEKFVAIQTVYNTLIVLSKIERDKFTTLQASSLIREVGALYNEIKDFVMKIDAVKVARGVHLHGPPKMGKSFIANAIHKLHCLARGVDYRPEDNAQINLMSEFFDNLANSTQTITINETSAIKEKYAKSLEVAFAIALALIDPVPYHPNRSNLEDKSKVTLTHISVVSTGNTEEPFIHVAKTPGAWTRRYTSVYMKVKPEYADEDGRFDPRKVDDTNDYHLFSVYEIVYDDVTGNKTRKYFTVDGKRSENINTRECFELLRTLALEHYANEDKLEEKRKSGEALEGCTACQRLKCFCVCGKQSESEVNTSLTTEDDSCCQAQPKVDGVGVPCSYEAGCCYCTYCGNDPESVCEPEAGNPMGSLLGLGTSLAYEAAVAWFNPFVKLKWLWSIDCATTESLREELMEEIGHFPDYLGTKLLSLIPGEWERKKDGSLSFFGRAKDRFLRLVAAEKQIFLPTRILLKRAFTLACIVFLLCTVFIFASDSLGYKRFEWEFPQRHVYHVTQYGWLPLFPQYSNHVMNNRAAYAAKGIYTLEHLNWKAYYVDLNFIQRLLGQLYYFWSYQEERVTYILVKRMAHWWHLPTFMSVAYFFVSFLYMWLRRTLGFQARYRELQMRASSDKELQKRLYDKIRRSPQEYNSLVPTAVGVLGVIMTGLAIWNIIRSRPEGGITRDEKSSWNSFFSFSREVPESEANNGLTDDDTVARVKKNICKVKAKVGGQDVEVVGTFIKSGLLMMPRHFFKPDPFKDELQEQTDVYIDHQKFKTKVRVYSESLVCLPGKDCVIIHVPKAPKVKHDVIDLLPTKTGSDCHKCTLVHLREDPEVTNARYVEKVDCGGYSCGRGVTYNSKRTQVGYCGTPVVRKGVILGFHISGDHTIFGGKLGNAQEIMKEDVEKYIESMADHPGFISTPEAGVAPKERLGFSLIKGKGPHPLTKVFEELAEYNGICVLGNNPDLVRYRSKVRKSSISDTFAEVSGKRNKWKAPDMRHPWVHHNLALKHVAQGAWEVRPSALKWAYDDYCGVLLKEVPKYTAEHPDYARVLTDLEMVNGIPESIYMKMVNMKSSIGPVGKGSGKKVDSDLFEEIERGQNNEKRFKLSDEALKYFNEMEDFFERGEKYGVWTRTCLKDEIVAEDSEKVRIFYILECVFALMVRKYYLPIVEFISRNPLLSECMVGINCASPEWEAVMQHVQELATDNMMTDWDYSKYDLKRSADVMIASLNVFKRIAKEFGYSERDLKVMDGIADELRNPTIDWNGTVITCFLWSSGNSITVYGNSIENSLHNRIAFFENTRLHPRREEFLKKGFRVFERIITYGDDGQSGCDPSVRDVCNFSAKSQYFDHIGMKITDAAKSSDPADCVDRDLIDFLKRKSVYHDALGCRVGALATDSIDKMAHMVHGKGELDELAVNAMITMLLEAFLHGPEVYEEYRQILRTVADRHNLWTVYLDNSYATLAEDWAKKFD